MTNVLMNAVTFLTSFGVMIGGGDGSSTFQQENLSRFCPGQMAVHTCKVAVFPGKQPKAEDTGVEPATHFWAIDFESTC
jgi:hypothetical protein